VIRTTGSQERRHTLIREFFGISACANQILDEGETAFEGSGVKWCPAFPLQAEVNVSLMCD